MYINKTMDIIQVLIHSLQITQLQTGVNTTRGCLYTSKQVLHVNPSFDKEH